MTVLLRVFEHDLYTLPLAAAHALYMHATTQFYSSFALHFLS